jgi:hypothetical protein
MIREIGLDVYAIRYSINGLPKYILITTVTPLGINLPTKGADANLTGLYFADPCIQYHLV